ncbi:MAG TPA: FHA domain-containing protein, partial [Egibacteraceae bacterium]
MHVVIEHHGRAHDVEVVLDDPCATVADLLAALEPPAPSDAVVTIDGHRVPRHRPLGDSLREGAVVRIGAGGAAVAARSASTTTPADGLVVAVVDGPAAGASAAPSGARLRIGRAGDADLVIADPAVSARHAELRRLPDGGVEVVDLGSRNGTVLDGRPVLGRARVPPGALLELGATRLRLRPQRSDDRPAALPLGPGGRVAFNRPPRPGLPPRPAPLPLPTPP